jgi:hypothetical protein
MPKKERRVNYGLFVTAVVLWTILAFIAIAGVIYIIAY